MARILGFALIASAVVVAVVALMRRRRVSVIEYDVYQPYSDSERDFELPGDGDDDAFAYPPPEGYPYSRTRTYN